MYKMAGGIVSKLETFAKQLGEGQYKPTQKFIEWALTGMIAAKSVVLAEMGRKLMEGFDSLNQVEKKLSYHVSNPRWNSEKSQEQYLQYVGKWIKQDTYIALDMGEITKTRARAMPYLDWVRDGSKKGTTQEKLALGWWKVEIEALVKKGGERFHLPLEDKVFATEEPGYKSEADVVFGCIDRILEHVGRLGIWIEDRGFDGESYFQGLAERKLLFVIRSTGKRHAYIAGNPGLRQSIQKWAEQTPLKMATCLLRKGRRHALRVGYREVMLPCLPDMRLFLVVCEGFGKEALMFLTNIEVSSLNKAVEMVEVYLARWGVEEGCRFMKQTYDVENLRSLTWLGIRRLPYMAMWCYGFLCLLALTSVKRTLNYLREIYPSFGPTPRFYYYRLAQAVSALLCPWPWIGFKSSA